MKNDLRITGRIIEILEPISGVSSNNRQWTQQQIILEVENTLYKNIVCLNLLRSHLINSLQVGMQIKACITIQSVEIKANSTESINAGKYISNVVAHKIWGLDQPREGPS